MLVSDDDDDQANLLLHDCETIRPPPLVWPGDFSYPSDGGMVAMGVHAACYWSVGG